MMRSAFEEVSAWASVLATMKSTPTRPGHDHVVDGIAARAADAADHDAGFEFPQFGSFEIDRHRLASRRWSALAHPCCMSCDSPEKGNGRRAHSDRLPCRFKNSSCSQRPTRADVTVRSGALRSSPPARLEMLDRGDLRIDQKADGGRKGRAFRRFGQALDAKRPADAGLLDTIRLRRLRHAGELAGAAGQNEPAARHAAQNPPPSAGRARVRESPRRAA